MQKKKILIWSYNISGACQQQLKSSNIQEDPCKAKNKVVPDVSYCDRYWECNDGQPELYDCPNGLVYAGKHRGVTEGCDYPWRADYCDGKTQASKLFKKNTYDEINYVHYLQ